MINPNKPSQTAAANEARRRSGATKRKRAHLNIGSAAARLFNGYGYLETQSKSVATYAGVSVASVFNYTPSKADLGREVIETSFDGFLEAAKREQGDSPITSRLVAEVFCHTIAAYPGIGHSLYNEKGFSKLETSQSLPKVHSQFTSTISAEQAEGVMRADIDPNAAANFLITALASQPAQVAQDPSRTNLHISMLFDGLTP